MNDNSVKVDEKMEKYIIRELLFFLVCTVNV